MNMRKRSCLLSVCCVALARSGASSMLVQVTLCFAVQRASFSVSSPPYTRTWSHHQAKSDDDDDDDEEEEEEEGAEGTWSHHQAKSDKEEEEGAEDTIRVRIWRALASGDELSLSKLGQAVGERRLGELRSHLVHVERQAKTLRNKSVDWKVRRGLISNKQSSDNDPSPFASKAKVRLKTRKGKKNEVLVRLA